jgi:hypothetical protein
MDYEESPTFRNGFAVWAPERVEVAPLYSGPTTGNSTKLEVAPL